MFSSADSFFCLFSGAEDGCLVTRILYVVIYFKSALFLIYLRLYTSVKHNKIFALPQDFFNLRHLSLCFLCANWKSA